jgi:hypothetical protein
MKQQTLQHEHILKDKEILLQSSKELVCSMRNIRAIMYPPVTNLNMITSSYLWMEMKTQIKKLSYYNYVSLNYGCEI